MAPTDLSSMQPGDAVNALRSFPRRFREAAATAAAADLDGEADDVTVEEMSSRPGPDGWSAVDVVRAAADRLADAHDVLGRALVTEVTVPARLATNDAPVPTSDAGSMADALGRLEASSTRLADLVADADPSRWTASLPVDGGASTTTLAVLQASMAPVVGWIREVEKVLRAVRGHPRR